MLVQMRREKFKLSVVLLQSVYSILMVDLMWERTNTLCCRDNCHQQDTFSSVYLLMLKVHRQKGFENLESFSLRCHFNQQTQQKLFLLWRIPFVVWMTGLLVTLLCWLCGSRCNRQLCSDISQRQQKPGLIRMWLFFQLHLKLQSSAPGIRCRS